MLHRANAERALCKVGQFQRNHLDGLDQQEGVVSSRKLYTT